MDIQTKWKSINVLSDSVFNSASKPHCERVTYRCLLLLRRHVYCSRPKPNDFCKTVIPILHIPRELNKQESSFLSFSSIYHSGRIDVSLIFQVKVSATVSGLASPFSMTYFNPSCQDSWQSDLPKVSVKQHGSLTVTPKVQLKEGILPLM